MRPVARMRVRREPAITRFLLKRFGLSVITLWLLSVIVFAASQLLPGNVGQTILGPLVPPEAVQQLNHRLGTDRPVLTQYWDWISNFVQGDFGTSFLLNTPVRPAVVAALEHSLKLALVAFLLVVPLSIVGGVICALTYGKTPDRIISVVGLSASAVPEFVWSVVFILIFVIWLHWLPLATVVPPGSSVLSEYGHLFLPALPLVFVLFGYIMRIARAGTIEALDADYTRTAYLKGLTRNAVLGRHVLRNSLLPTITVVATQVGYLIGGLAIVETIFNYPGIGYLILTAARGKDFPMLQSAVLTIGVVYLVATIIADVLYALLNPRIRSSIS
jgi:peptide/nickel transport system permease protein